MPLACPLFLKKNVLEDKVEMYVPPVIWVEFLGGVFGWSFGGWLTPHPQFLELAS